jgi:hypothetical protein
MLRKKSGSTGYGVLVVLSIIMTAVVFPAISAAEGKLYTFDPNTQKYELYDGSLYLWGTDNTDHSHLSASIGDVDRSTLHAWFGTIMAAQAMGKQVEVQYEPASGKILSVYGPK